MAAWLLGHNQGYAPYSRFLSSARLEADHRPRESFEARLRVDHPFAIGSVPVKHLKFGIMACAALGLATCFIGDQAIWKAHGLPGLSKHIYMIIGGFAAALVMAGVAVARPPLLRWQSGVAVAGFALVLVKIRDGLFQGNFLNGKLLSVVVLVGLALAIASLVKREDA
jgi:hypothetical protein